MQNKNYCIGIDLAWSENNLSGMAVLEDDEVIFCDTVETLDDIVNIVSQYPDAKIGIDAPLYIPNEVGNRDIEKEFLKDYSSKKLGVYPVNRNLLANKDGVIRSELLVDMLPQRLGMELFEVYPHVTILECFHKKVLPYKRKKGRDTAFIKEQLDILQKYLKSTLKGSFAVEIKNLKGKALKSHEDKLDAIVCGYTLLYAKTNPYKLYGDIFMVPSSTT